MADVKSLRATVCIVGAGAAGIAMALDFVGTGIEVLLLEAGGLAEEPQTQALYGGEVADPRLHSPPDKYRQRRFGGTTTIWGGRCMPFDPIDFETRDFMPDSGWPIAREALAAFYPRANRLCEAGEFAYSSEAAFPRPTRPIIEGFAGEHFTANTLERFSCPTDFAARYGHTLQAAANIRVILHANVTSLSVDAARRSIVGAYVRNLRGGDMSVHAEYFVLATGGLEVPRLLLASNAVLAHGIGNEHDVVGRYYMCHLAGTIGRIKIEKPAASVWHGYEISDEGIYVRRRFALRESTQRAAKLGNFVARLHHPRITEPDHRNSVLSLLYLSQMFIPYEYRLRLAGAGSGGLQKWLQHVRNVAFGVDDAVAFAWHMLRDRKLAERKFPSIIVKSKANLFSLDFHAEQQPNPASRITLGDGVDALGMPRLRIDWRYTSVDVDTVTRSLALLAQDFEHNRLGTFDYDPGTVEAEMTRYGAYGGHHIGTARMGNDPRTSVVDADCRVHGMANLFVAGAATFPTSSQANPTLTLVALALRLSRHLRDRLGRDAAAHSTDEAAPVAGEMAPSAGEGAGAAATRPEQPAGMLT